jgi:hypothetical protein
MCRIEEPPCQRSVLTAIACERGDDPDVPLRELRIASAAEAAEE